MFNALDYVYETNCNSRVDTDLKRIAEKWESMPDFQETNFSNVLGSWKESHGHLEVICTDGSTHKIEKPNDFFSAFTLLTSVLFEEYITAIDERDYYREVEDLFFNEALQNNNVLYDLTRACNHHGEAKERVAQMKERILEKVTYGALWVACVIYDSTCSVDRNKIL